MLLWSFQFYLKIQHLKTIKCKNVTFIKIFSLFIPYIKFLFDFLFTTIITITVALFVGITYEYKGICGILKNKLDSSINSVLEKLSNVDNKAGKSKMDSIEKCKIFAQLFNQPMLSSCTLSPHTYMAIIQLQMSLTTFMFLIIGFFYQRT
ncbi:hypothetical protein NECID01_0639 [Nematocida sp. AWRm77]|nr:hypothetical protein NECID01_0639 [Nematocida sp. AWRm77]